MRGSEQQSIVELGRRLHVVKTAFLLLFSLAYLSCAAKLNKQEPFVTLIYKPTLLYAAAAAQSHGGDPIAEAKTTEQRRFLTEYYRVLREDKNAIQGDRAYLFMEPLRRCGIAFPEGTSVTWLPIYPPLRVVHTREAAKQIEKYMRLTPDQ
jgi:hypothetical protein